MTAMISGMVTSATTRALQVERSVAPSAAASGPRPLTSPMTKCSLPSVPVDYRSDEVAAQTQSLLAGAVASHHLQTRVIDGQLRAAGWLRSRA